MEWIILIFLAVIVGYILAESNCLGVGECIRDVFDCVGSVINFIGCIFNRSRTKSFSHEQNKFQDKDISRENSNLIGISAIAVEDFKGDGRCYCEGYVKANGTYWKSVCKICKISKGDIVIIKNMENLTVEVEPVQ